MNDTLCFYVNISTQLFLTRTEGQDTRTRLFGVARGEVRSRMKFNTKPFATHPADLDETRAESLTEEDHR